MTDQNHHRTRYRIGPIGAVATVPAEFLSSAIFELVRGAYYLGECLARAVRGLRRR